MTLDPRSIVGKSEDGLQTAVMAWAALNAKRWPQLRMLFHVANGGQRSKREGAKFKAMGVRPGVPDLFLPVARKGCHGLFIELKIGKNAASAKQEAWHEWLKAESYFVEVVWTYDRAIELLEWYLGE